MTEAAPYFADIAEGPPDGFARWLKAADGVTTRAAFWPVPDARATVLILPGRTEHAEKYGRTAFDLAKRGFACIAIDWRGQGLSDRLVVDRRIGHVDRFSDYQLDLEATLRAVGDAGLPPPRFMIAHSMSGAIGLRAIHNGLPVSACAFSAPMWGINVPMGLNRFFEGLTGLATKLRLGARYAPAPATGPVCYLETAPFEDNVLSSDPESFAWMKSHLVAHPELAIGGPSLQWLHEALRECRALAAMTPPKLPVLTALGSNERVVPPEVILERTRNWPGGKLVVVEGAEHEIMMEGPAMRDQFIDACMDLFDSAP